jgi:hypothetical protein
VVASQPSDDLNEADLRGVSQFRQNATVAASSLASLFGRPARPMSYGNDFRLSWARTGLGSKQAF